MPDPCTRLRPASKSVGDLLGSSFFRIPQHQRPYKWKNEQLEKLWSDLESTIREDGKREPGRELGHFLGAIVVVGTETSHDTDRWLVLDGQQRLTTLSIIAETLRQYLIHVTDERIKEALSSSLRRCISDSSNFSPRMRLNREDKFYQSSLLENWTFDEKERYWNDHLDQASPSQSSIVRAFRLFREKIDNYLESCSDKQEAIRDLVETLTSHFFCMLIRTEEANMAYKLFETLNDRGLDLSQAELINNELNRQATIAGLDLKQIDRYWTRFLDNWESANAMIKMEPPELVQFSYTYRQFDPTSQNVIIIKKDRIFEFVSEDLETGRQDALEFADKLAADSSNWCDFLQGDLANWSQETTDARSAIVSALWKAHATPFIMASIDLLGSDDKQLQRAFVACENFLFREGLVGGLTVSNLQIVFSTAAAKLRIDRSVDSAVEYFSSKSSDTRYKEAFAQASVKNSKQAFYMTSKIEQYLQREQLTTAAQSAQLHVEHIMPRRPDESWEGIQENESFSAYLNRFGNLLILDRDTNSTISNKSIKYKISNSSNRDYTHSPQAVTRQVAERFENWSEKGDWTFQSIIDRQQFMAEKYALAVWPISN